MWAISASPLVVTTPIMNCSGPAAQPVAKCSVALTKQHSESACVLGDSFGCDDNVAAASMWTDKGCRGEFSCDGVQSVTCDVDGDGRHACACAPATPVKCKGWISELQKDILLNPEVLAVNQDVTPQGRPSKDGQMGVWARKLSDGSVAVALYNEEDAAQSLAVSFADLGWSEGQKATVRDLWARKDEGSFTGRYPASGGVQVEPHAAKLVRISPA